MNFGESLFTLDEELEAPFDSPLDTDNESIASSPTNSSNGTPAKHLDSPPPLSLKLSHYVDNALLSPTLSKTTSATLPPLPVTTGKRRSSVLSKFPVLSPTYTRRISISQNTLDATTPEQCVIDKAASPPPVSTPLSTHQTTASPDETTLNNTYNRTLQDFQPLKVLGRGAYGKVLLVRDTRSKKLYAMKQLKKAEILVNEDDIGQDDNNKLQDTGNNEDKGSGTSRLSKRIRQTFEERKILSQLEHPNIVKLFYSFHDHSKLYLILQYIPGGELFFHLKERGTLDEDTVAFYAAEISCALKFLHGNGIIYRDLKPENCLLDEKGHLVLTDFGLSKQAISNPQIDGTQPKEQQGIPLEQREGEEEVEEVDTDGIYMFHSIIGTPEYAAPEILEGLPYSRNCDWYSLGCLMYDMLIGKPPYTGADYKVILSKIQRDKQGPRLPYYLSDGMKDVLNWLLKRDKTKRWNVDKYWNEAAVKKTGKQRPRKKSNKQRISIFQTHIIFRKVDWKRMESGDLQRQTLGPIVPLITDWALAENFDEEFTSMSFEDDYMNKGVSISSTVNKATDIFKGFSFKASGSYLERYF